ncbi:ABC transporter permease [Facklamia miroungae]|uniref:ABC-2 family transporter protein n=1 Tax=Facklamia miroungae TaxID=120956 RepID=A0A1G7QSU2_9LACT|nr:ABC transporter permease [Facklamia miroungae]NKZ29052.1 ABC transporter permease [Facklamia miroungae]SDG01582.1 ABC-2 family transporter protein [Facklamia miroungae]
MFKHILTYTPKLFYRSMEGALYGILFPIAFAIVINLALSNILNTGSNLDPIRVALVIEGNQIEEQLAKETFSHIAKEGLDYDKKIQNDQNKKEVKYIAYQQVTNLDEGRKLSESEQILATIKIDNHNFANKMSIEINPAFKNSYRSSVLYTILESYGLLSQGVSNQLVNHHNAGESKSDGQDNNFKLAGLSPGEMIKERTRKKNTSSNSVFYYATFGYLCIFFMTMGTSIIEENEAYHSAQALRMTTTPINKFKRFLATFIGRGIPCLLVNYIVLLIFKIFHAPIGIDYLRILILSTLGVILGLLLGTTSAAIFKRNQGLYNVVSVLLPLLFSFLAGMMSDSVKILVNQKAAWINKINPVTLISDSLYYLNNYPNYNHFNQNILIIIGIIIICMIGTYLGLRRTDYASL